MINKTLLLLVFVIAIAPVGANPEEKDLKITGYIDEDVFVGIEYNKLFRIDNLNHTNGVQDDIDLSVSYNISLENIIMKQDTFHITGLNAYKTAGTGDYTFNLSGNHTICGLIINSTVNDTNQENDFVCYSVIARDTNSFFCNVSINISAEKTFYNDSEQIKFWNKLNNDSFHYVIEYWIEDLLGNLVKNKINTSNQNQKVYTPHIDEMDKVLVLKNRIVELGCNNTSENVTDIDRVIVVKEEDNAAINNESNASIIEVMFEEGDIARFGELVDVELDVYKGDTRKKLLDFYIEDENGRDISYKSKAYFNSKYTDYSLRVPILLKSNCNNRQKAGDSQLVVKGLDIEIRHDIKVGGKKKGICQEKENKTKEKATEEKNETKKSFLKSFYTRTKKPKNEINLYSSIETPEGKRLVFESSLEIQEFVLGEENNSIKIVAKIITGKNLYSLRLFEGEDKIDEKSLVVNKNATVKSKKQEATPINNTNSTRTEKIMDKVTGFATGLIYESSSRKAYKLAPYFMFAFLSIIVLHYIVKK